MLKNLTYIILLFTLIACSQNDVPDIPMPPVEEVKYIKLNLGGGNVSSADGVGAGSFEGTGLPDGLVYGVYVLDNTSEKTIEDGDNVKVINGADGKGTPQHGIYIWSGEEFNLYGYYPYNSDANWDSYFDGKVTYEENPLVDALWTVNAVPVNYDNPHANLVFRHIKSRFVFNFRIDEDSDLGYDKFTYRIKNVFTKCEYDIKKGEFIYDDEDAENIGYEVGNLVMKSDTSLYYQQKYTSECLIIPMPSNIEWQVMLEIDVPDGDTIQTVSAQIKMPDDKGWESGKSYMYDVIVPAPYGEKVEVIISPCTIIPWVENPTQSIVLPEVEECDDSSETIIPDDDNNDTPDTEQPETDNNEDIDSNE